MGVVEFVFFSKQKTAYEITPPAGTEILDAGERTVMPGMIDAHVQMLSTRSNASGV